MSGRRISELTVLGAGVLGLTVAIVARLMGHNVKLVGERHICDVDGQSDSFFASAFPAASIIPHTVAADDLEYMVSTSDRVFGALRRCKVEGVRIQQHFEVAEVPLPVPDYMHDFKDFRRVGGGTPSPIRREGGAPPQGFSFSCYFCDMPIYAPWLSRLASRMGVVFERRRVDVAWLKSNISDVVVNCLGSGAHSLYEDVGPGAFYRGILLVGPPQGANRGKRAPISYNYTPPFSCFPGFKGAPSDVYCYPRSRDSIFGGTRQPGTLDTASRKFVASEELQGELVRIEGVDVPKAIIDLNGSLVEQLTGERPTGPFRPIVGYRHMDGTLDDPRVTIRTVNRNGLAPHIDCFGFGGAGVTLSWGAGLKVLALCRDSYGLSRHVPTPLGLARMLSRYLRSEPTMPQPARGS